MEQLSIGFRFVVFVVVVLLWILAVVAQILMVANRKSGVSLFQARLLFNPLIMQFLGRQYLTEKGIFWRNVSWASVAIFLLLVLVQV